MIAVSKRERILLVLTLSVLGLLLLERVWWRRLQAAWTKADEQFAQSQTELSRAQRLIENRKLIEKEWAQMQEQIERTRKGTAASFQAHLSRLEQEARIAEKSRKPLRAEEHGSYRVEAFQLQLQCSLEQLVRFLDALDSSERFVRVGPLRITSVKRGELDVHMEVSTLVFGAPPTKEGTT
ncbi:MAG: hypothetical protein FJ279_14275 [Planctomycetes bacterium]|nr:hypothetical protein [Planctomycetota bacterium]MBM4085941.1 hypothetical protein [Planctomycetota bacterium]